MYLLRSPPEPDLKIQEKMKIFFVGHWRGFVLTATPIVFSFFIIPDDDGVPPYCYCAYTLALMGVFWMTECLPLAVTALLPMIIFPLSGIMTTFATASCYVNDTVLMFLGSLMLAYSVEQSGLHKRLAYNTIMLVGFSHTKLLFGICLVTTFVSMWITNTAATTMMVPIIFAILGVFDKQGIVKMFEAGPGGEKYASDISVCYFCCATYSATIGGIGTLIGTGTNLVFKGLYEKAYPTEDEHLSFPKFSMFSVPYMVALEACVYLSLSVQYFGAFRAGSEIAKKSAIPENIQKVTKRVIEDEMKKMGKVNFHEIMVLILFGGAIVAFFCRSPQIFPGWADKIDSYFGRTGTMKYIKDSALCAFVTFLMFLLPASMTILKNFTAKCYEQLPNKPIVSILDWGILNDMMPYSFMFLLGGGFAVSTAAKETGMNEKISQILQFMTNLDPKAALLVIVVSVILITNFASNVAVANVFVPIYMVIADNMKMNPLWACIAAGFSASHCFLLPVGTPGNLIVQGAANIRTLSMIKCGAIPTACTIIFTWLFLTFYAPIVWPNLRAEGEPPVTPEPPEPEA